MTEGKEPEAVSMVSIVVPTYKEAEGLQSLVEQTFTALSGLPIAGELIIVDDNSPDGTGEVADELARRYPVKVVHRPGKLGLASAVMDGFAVAEGDILGVMDADLSHPPSLLPAMIAAIVERGADLAVASRHVRGGGVKNWPRRRQAISSFANLLARPVTAIHDATSGYFLIRRRAIDGVKLEPIGFKIGLEVMVKANYRTWEEVPYIFTDRRYGQSKFNKREVLNYLLHLGALMVFRARRWLRR
ncbi:MAG: polyprenol monophosphomannose synthase [Chloroflexi bacterium]|nr:polyprenol monophosphomannose synthase [Chloroflexota bacterium]MCL5026412.1 polyprenol monophosphomannose synthase [Chloroflexota bacterium]